ncbi:MAG: ATPase [Euryarchaeota archaeon]|nr:ATPase [Euryarchaeota archaeon]
MKNKTLSKAFFAIFALAWLITLVPAASAQGESADNASTVEAANAQARGLIAIGAGLAVGLSGLGSGWGESTIGAAAVGAMAENEKLFGRGLIMTVLPETIVIFGLVVSLLLVFVF